MKRDDNERPGREGFGGNRDRREGDRNNTERSFRPGHDRPSSGRRDDGPRSDNRRDFSQRSETSNRDRPGNERPGYDKPRFGRPDERPGQDRPSFGQGRSEGGFRRDDRNGDKPRFERGERSSFSNDRPFRERRDDNRNDGPGRDRPGRDGSHNERPGYDKPRSFGQRSEGGFRRDNERPRFERRDDRNDGPRNDGPRNDSPRSYGDRRNEGGESRFGRSDGSRERRFDDRSNSGERRPYGDRNEGFRPGQNRNNDERPNRFGRSDGPGHDRSSERRFDERSNDRFGDKPSRPFERRDDRPDRPRFERGDRNDKPNYDKPRFGRPDDRTGRDRPSFGQGRSEGGFRRDDRNGDKPRFERGERSGFSNDRRGGDQPDRRAGRFTKAPNYNLDAAREHLPRRKQVELSQQERQDDGTIRLNRYIANAGICSRREADELIARGDVTVNGTVVTEMGHRVQPGSVVKYGTKVLNPEKMVYLLLNKPKDYITTTEDPEERRTVMDLVSEAGPYRIYPIGRLDRNTTGLLLMTNDGELAEKLTHPSNNVKKIYQAELDKPITNEHFEALQQGIELEDGFIKPDDIALVTPDAQVVGIEIHSGRNRIVRRMFEHFGYEVTKLDRTVFAGLTKKELPRGKWRFLDQKEVVKIKYLS